VWFEIHPQGGNQDSLLSSWFTWQVVVLNSCSSSPSHMHGSIRLQCGAYRLCNTQCCL